MTGNGVQVGQRAGYCSTRRTHLQSRRMMTLGSESTGSIDTQGVSILAVRYLSMRCVTRGQFSYRMPELVVLLYVLMAYSNERPHQTNKKLLNGCGTSREMRVIFLRADVNISFPKYSQASGGWTFSHSVRKRNVDGGGTMMKSKCRA